MTAYIIITRGKLPRYEKERQMRNTMDKFAAFGVVIAALAPALYTFTQISSGII